MPVPSGQRKFRDKARGRDVLMFRDFLVARLCSLTPHFFSLALIPAQLTHSCFEVAQGRACQNE